MTLGRSNLNTCVFAFGEALLELRIYWINP